VSEELSKWGIGTFAGSKKGVTGLQDEHRAIGNLESDCSSDHPADDRAGVPVKPGRLGRSKFDSQHLDTLDLRLGLESCGEQRVAQNGPRVRHRRHRLFAPHRTAPHRTVERGVSHRRHGRPATSACASHQLVTSAQRTLRSVRLSIRFETRSRLPV